jgi:hypothetical protein
MVDIKHLQGVEELPQTGQCVQSLIATALLVHEANQRRARCRESTGNKNISVEDIGPEAAGNDLFYSLRQANCAISRLDSR